MTWERQGRARDRRRENLGGGEGTRAVNRGVKQTDGGPMLRKCQGEGNYQRGRRWGVLRANWNGEVRVQGHNTSVKVGRHFWKQDRRGMRGSGNIIIATLNISSGRAGGLKAELRALRQGNVGVGVLQETKLTDRIHARQG